MTQQRLADGLPLLLAERGWSLRQLAREAGISARHLSRAMRGVDYRSPGGELAGRIAEALELPRDYFPEYRERVVVDAVRADPKLRERIYRQVDRER